LRHAYSYRNVARSLSHIQVTRKQVWRIIHKAELGAIYSERNLSKPRRGAAKYPYLLKDKKISVEVNTWNNKQEKDCPRGISVSKRAIYCPTELLKPLLLFNMMY
jgi:hypothetical protein